MQPIIRPLAPDDDIARLTALIHAAYAPHGARGLRYWGTHQTVEDTASRFAAGYALIAQANGEYAGTITVRAPQPDSPVALYRDPHTWSISQFAVAPEFKGKGVGKMLHGAALDYARSRGARTMALDTAQPAAALIAMWRAWGYREAGTADWRPHTNYLSVVMCQPVNPPPENPDA